MPTTRLRSKYPRHVNDCKCQGTCVRCFSLARWFGQVVTSWWQCVWLVVLVGVVSQLFQCHTRPRTRLMAKSRNGCGVLGPAGSAVGFEPSGVSHSVLYRNSWGRGVKSVGWFWYQTCLPSNEVLQLSKYLHMCAKACACWSYALIMLVGIVILSSSIAALSALYAAP